MKHTFKALAIAFLVLFNGCSKGDGDEIVNPASNVTISATETNVKDTQIVSVIVNDYQLNLDQYQGTFGNTSINLAKVDDDELVFIVPPNIAPGNYELSLTFASNKLNFSVSTTTLSGTPDNLLTNFIGSYNVDIDEAIDLMNKAQVPHNLNQIKSDIEKAINDFQNLSEDDKIIAIKFIENNATYIDQLESALAAQSLVYSGKSAKNNCDAACYFVNAVKILGAALLTKLSATTGAIVAVALAIEVGISLSLGKCSILLSKVYAALTYVFNIAYFGTTNLGKVTFDAIDNRVTNELKSGKKTKIANNTGITFEIKPVYRTLNETDKNSSDTTIKQLVTKYLEFRTYWNTKWAAKLGQLPSFNDKKEQKEAKELSQFSVAISENSENVEVSGLKGTAKEFSATFTNKTDIEQDFSFEISFTDKEVTAKETLNFTINFDEIALEKISGDNQTGVRNKELNNPIVVKVIDEKGNGLKDIEVNFEVTAGEGSLSAAVVMTNSDGLAKVSWTLGDNLDEQKLQASLKNSVGEHVPNSPMTFSATSTELELFLEKTSGDNQSGEADKQLQDPLTIRVVDEDGNGIPDIDVTYSVTKGNGYLDTYTTTTNSSGYANTYWTLGNDETTQTVKVEAKYADATNITNSPITFTATKDFNLVGTWDHTTLDTNWNEYGIVCNGTYNEKRRITSETITFSSNAKGVTVTKSTIVKYPDANCTSNGWDLGTGVEENIDESSSFDWSLNGSTIVLIFDQGTDRYDYPFKIIDENTVQIGTGSEAIILKRM